MTKHINLPGGWVFQAGLSFSCDWLGVGEGLGGFQELQLEAGNRFFTFHSWQQTELLPHPAQRKTSTNQLEDADKIGPNNAADGPGSCHQSGMHSEILLPPLKVSCQSNEVLLLHLILLPGSRCVQSPKPGPSQPWAQPFRFWNWAVGSLHLLPRPFDAPTQK